MVDPTVARFRPEAPALGAGTGNSPLRAALDEAGHDYDRAARSEATWRAYRSDCEDFACWCERLGLRALPAAVAPNGSIVADANGENGWSSTSAIVELGAQHHVTTVWHHNLGNAP